MVLARLARLLSAGLAALAVAGSWSAAPGPRPPLRVEMWGDSIAMQVAPYFTYLMGASGKATGRSHWFPGSALCGWLPDIRSELDPADPAAFHPQVIVVEFTGVAATACMRDGNGVPLSGQALIDKYAADAAQVIAMATKENVPVYFASAPIYRVQAAQGYVGVTPLGLMFSKLPARYPGGIARFVNAALAVEWHGHYTDMLPCERGETCTGRWPDGTKTVVVREADGGHFCPVPEVFLGGEFGLSSCPVASPGAYRYSRAIATRVLDDIG